MSDAYNGIDPLDDMPEAVVLEKKRQISFVWIVPLVALVIGAWLVVKAYTEKGPTITITFASAEGIEAGKTKIRYKDVEVGKVTDIDLSDDLSRVVLKAEMNKTAERFLSPKTRFWVVRARVAAREISGLSTLFSGAYIGLDPGPPGEPLEHYTGLDTPPVITTEIEGRQFILTAERLGSVDIGSPVYFRQIEVGRVTSLSLDVDRQTVSVKVFIDAPYHKLVKKNSRFWNASGVEVSMGAGGVHLNTESIVSMLIGGVAFDTPTNFESNEPAKENDAFRLHESRAAIFEESYALKRLWLLQFEGSIRGLSVGAPVEFRGIRLGKVLDIDARWDPESEGIQISVLIETEPQRISGPMDMVSDERFRDIMDRWVKRGLRAQLQTGNMITGQLYVGFDFHQEPPPAAIDWSGRYPKLPTLPGRMEMITASVTGFLDRLTQLPIEEIGQGLQQTIEGANTLMNSEDLRQSVTDLRAAMTATKELTASLNASVPPAMDDIHAILATTRNLSAHLNENVLPAIDSTLSNARKAMKGVSGTFGPESETIHRLNRSLIELREAATAVRGLADYLERHPDALIYGKEAP